jgi:hypothetical protein
VSGPGSRVKGLFHPVCLSSADSRVLSRRVPVRSASTTRAGSLHCTRHISPIRSRTRRRDGVSQTRGPRAPWCGSTAFQKRAI